MPKFKCPDCSRGCILNKKLSDIRGRPESERLYVWVCDGQSKQSPHGPTVFREQVESVVLDGFGRIQNKISKITKIIVEDGEMHELLDEFKTFMREERYRHLGAKAGIP